MTVDADQRRAGRPTTRARPTSEDTPKGITLTGLRPRGQRDHVRRGPARARLGQPDQRGSSVTYTPDADYCGPDSFTFHTNDGTVDSANGTVSITVTCVNDAPVVDLNGGGTGRRRDPRPSARTVARS